MALGPSAYRKKRLARFCLAKNPLETGMDLIRIMVAFEAAQAKVNMGHGLVIYLVYATTRNSAGFMTRKLSVTVSHSECH